MPGQIEPADLAMLRQPTDAIWLGRLPRLMHCRGFCSNQLDAEAIYAPVVAHLDVYVGLLAELRDVIEQLICSR